MHILIIILNFFSWFSFYPKDVIAFVNGEAVYKNELKLQMYDQRAGVYTYIAGKYNLGEQPIRWKKKYGKEIPIEILKKIAMSNIIEVKVQQLCMRYYGIQKDITWPAFQNAFVSINKERIRSEERGELLFGPSQFSESTYFHYVFTNNLNQLKDSLSANNVVTKSMYKNWLSDEVKRADVKIISYRLKRLKI